MDAPSGGAGGAVGNGVGWLVPLDGPQSGELFLYVNDAIQVFPFFGPLDLYYKNNSGTAQVQIQRVPLPRASAE